MALSFDKYQSLSVSRANSAVGGPVALATAGLGLTGEAGEVADIIKKHIGQGHALDTDKVIDEMGDVLWYLAWLADQVGTTLSNVAELNVIKLAKRYPEGFTTEASVNRSEEPKGCSRRCTREEFVQLSLEDL